MTGMILETERLVLREMAPGDFDDLFRIFSDPETMRFYPRPYDRPMLEAVIARAVASYAERGHGLWAMTLKGGEQVIGDCGLIAQEVEGVEETEIGYHIRRDFWGLGLATEAARACRDYGFERLGRTRLISMIRPENLPSRRVAEKNGMRVEKEIFWRGFRHCVYVIEKERD